MQQAYLWMRVVCIWLGAAAIETLVYESPTFATTCRSNADCACGWNDATATCEIGSPEQVDGDNEECFEFCHGFSATLAPICRLSECVRTRRSLCPGDCDADGVVSVAEVVSGVDIALGESSSAVCGAFDSNTDGGVTVDELLRAVVAALQGCAAAIPLPSDIAALYDTSITFDGQRTVRTLGRRSVATEPTTFTINISPNEALSLNGVVRADAQFDLDGSGFYTDIAYWVRGTARQSGGPDQERIEGLVHPEQAFLPPFMSASFIMQRGTATAVPFAGTYRFELSVSPGDPRRASSLTLPLDVAASGVAVISGGTDIGMGGASLGTVTPGNCLIAAGGSLTCDAVYLVKDSKVSAPFRLTGKLDVVAEGVTGGGRYLAGVDPPYDIYVPGGWTATRVNSVARVAGE